MTNVPLHETLAHMLWTLLAVKLADVSAIVTWSISAIILVGSACRSPLDLTVDAPAIFGAIGPCLIVIGLAAVSFCPATNCVQQCCACLSLQPQRCPRCSFF
jgi:hypothetical protein